MGAGLAAGKAAATSRAWKEQHGRKTPCRHAGWRTASHRRLVGSVARLPGRVATRRAHLKHPFVADLHGAGFRTPGFAHVPDAGAGDCHHPRSTSFAVVRSDRRSALEGLAIRVCAGWALEDNV